MLLQNFVLKSYYFFFWVTMSFYHNQNSQINELDIGVSRNKHFHRNFLFSEIISSVTLLILFAISKLPMIVKPTYND